MDGTQSRPHPRPDETPNETRMPHRGAEARTAARFPRAVAMTRLVATDETRIDGRDLPTGRRIGVASRIRRRRIRGRLLVIASREEE